jgi:hypothetical protein
VEVTGVKKAEGLERRQGPPSVADGRDSSSVTRRAVPVRLRRRVSRFPP